MGKLTISTGPFSSFSIAMFVYQKVPSPFSPALGMGGFLLSVLSLGSLGSLGRAEAPEAMLLPLAPKSSRLAERLASRAVRGTGGRPRELGGASDFGSFFEMILIGFSLMHGKHQDMTCHSGLENWRKLLRFTTITTEILEKGMCFVSCFVLSFSKMSCHVVLHPMHGGGQSAVFGAKFVKCIDTFCLRKGQ